MNAYSSRRSRLASSPFSPRRRDRPRPPNHQASTRLPETDRSENCEKAAHGITREPTYTMRVWPGNCRVLTCFVRVSSSLDSAYLRT